MNTIIFNISRGEILAEVAKVTAYAGAKDADPEQAFDRVATVKDDAGLLARYWADACAAVTERLKGFVALSVAGDEEWELRLDMSGAYEGSLTPAVREGLFSAVAAYVTARWFRLTLPERAGEWESEWESLLGETVRRLYHRKAPRRRRQGASGNENV